MPIEVKQLAGIMNMDDPKEVIPNGHHSDCRNMWFRGVLGNMRGENIPGLNLLVNPLIPGDTNNLTIGKYYDPVGRRVIFFNYRAGGNDGIYIYYPAINSFQRLVEEGVNADIGALDFNPLNVIYNINIIYGDSLQGDILYFIDSLGVPRKINIQRALTGGYGTIKKSYMDVAKEPPSIPLVAVYENDPSNTINGCRKKLFKFKERYVFDDHDKSVTSSQSELPLPMDAFDQQTDADATKNCRIALVYQTGAANVKKIELLAAVSLGNVFSDYFLIASIDKAVEGLSDNDLGTFLFYNNQGYNYIDIDESNQLFDYVPRISGCQTLLNGNVLAYGNITEGYPNLTNFTDGLGDTSNISGSNAAYYYGTTWSRLEASQSGDSGFGNGNIHIVIRGIVNSASFSLDTYVVYMTDATTIQYTLNTGDDVAAVINGLRSDAISKGYTIISSGNNDLIVSKPVVLARTGILSNYLFNAILYTSFFAYDWSSNHAWGLVYFDQKGRTNGVVYTSGFSVNAAPYSEGTVPNKPIFNASIYHQPPNWAYYFQWVRTKDLSKSKIQQWVSDRTFKDTIAVSGAIKYAYISIETLNTFIAANPGTPLGYGFTPGDRIKFFRRINADNSTATLYSNTKDFEVVASLVNPTINGEVKTGQFIKIVLPATDGTFDFGDGFSNYFIELYTPAQSVANNLNVYYEYGERYAIGNPTVGNNFHQGMLQNQIPNSNTPATFEFSSGDYYARLRAIQVGNTYNYNITNGTLTAGRILIGMNFTGSTYTDPNVTAQSAPFSNVSGNTPHGGFDPNTDTRWHLAATNNTTFTIKGTISLSFNSSGDTSIPWRVFIKNKFTDEFNLVEPFSPGTGGVFTFTINSTITLENDHIFLVAEGGERPITVLSSTWEYINNDHVISQIMIDQNFSDYFPSAVNSNGRAFIFNENANEVTFPTIYRWSLAYQSDTNINQANRFYPQNFDNVDRSFGALKSMKIYNRQLTFFQERKCGQTNVFGKVITDSSGNTQLLTTDSIITSNNVQYYLGDYGCGNQPQAIIQSGYVFYFPDPIKSRWFRLSMDGLIDLGEKYKCQTWFGQNIPKYLNPGDYPYGGKQKLVGTFNYRPDNTSEVILVGQGSVLLSVVTPGEAINFNEELNAFQSKYDFDCDEILCAENVLYFWKNGFMWKVDTTTQYTNFFGVQQTASIEIPYTENIPIKKTFNATGYTSNQTWFSPTQGDVKTNGINSQTLLLQQSLIMQEDYNILENPSRYAAINRDMNSMSDPTIALWEGDYMRGNWMSIKYSYGGNQFSYFMAPFLNYQTSSRNP